MAPGFAGSAWLKDKFLEIFAEHRASLDPKSNNARFTRSKRLREAWEKFMQEIIAKGLVKPGTNMSSVQNYIQDQRGLYKRKTKEIHNMEAGVAWTLADLPIIQAFAPIPGMTVGAEAAGNDGGGYAGSGVDAQGVILQHMRPWIEEKTRWLDVLRHGKVCQAPAGQCQFSQHGISCVGRFLWGHFSNCANPKCTTPMCEVRMYAVQHLKDCIDGPCDMCTLLKPYLPDGHMAQATAEQEQAQLHTKQGPAGSSIQHQQDLGAMHQREQLQQLVQHLPAHYRPQELRLDNPGDAGLVVGREQHFELWLAGQRGWFLLLRHGKECRAPFGPCQFSRDVLSCQHDKLLWDHFCSCANPDCTQHVCAQIKRHMLQHYKVCLGEPCPVCTRVKQWFLDFDMALATNVEEQAQQRPNLGLASSSNQHHHALLAVQQPQQHVEQGQQQVQFLPAHHRQPELCLEHSGRVHMWARAIAVEFMRHCAMCSYGQCQASVENVSCQDGKALLHHILYCRISDCGYGGCKSLTSSVLQHNKECTDQQCFLCMLANRHLQGFDQRMLPPALEQERAQQRSNLRPAGFSNIHPHSPASHKALKEGSGHSSANHGRYSSQLAGNAHQHAWMLDLVASLCHCASCRISSGQCEQTLCYTSCSDGKHILDHIFVCRRNPHCEYSWCKCTTWLVLEHTKDCIDQHCSLCTLVNQDLQGIDQRMLLAAPKEEQAQQRSNLQPAGSGRIGASHGTYNSPLVSDAHQHAQMLEVGMFLCHCASCRTSSGQCQQTFHNISCSHGNNVLDHILICRHNPQCGYIWCKSMWRIVLQHNEDCTDQQCSLCALVKQPLHDIDQQMLLAAPEQKQAQQRSNLRPAGAVRKLCRLHATCFAGTVKCVRSRGAVYRGAFLGLGQQQY